MLVSKQHWTALTFTAQNHISQIIFFCAVHMEKSCTSSIFVYTYTNICMLCLQELQAVESKSLRGTLVTFNLTNVNLLRTGQTLMTLQREQCLRCSMMFNV